MSSKKDIIYQIVQESRAYNTLEDIEKLVDGGASLAMIPVQPLYIALSSSGSDQVAEVLPKLSKPQRQAMLDLDLWQKDEVDYQSFDFWVETYSKVKDTDIVQEFVHQEDFALYLRSRVNIYTFDVEDPQYPDHDFYFLTDDSLLLIEYGEDYQYPTELKYLIRNLYDKLGVEKAYSHLFKVVNDSHLILEEKQYQLKKERLRDYGFVDYYEALEHLVEFPSYKSLDQFIETQRPMTAEVDSLARNQGLHHSALIGFDQEKNLIVQELAKVKDEQRLAYLHFTFVRLINSTITVSNALKGGRVELTRISKTTHWYLDLGVEYLRSKTDEVLLDRFDFFAVYKVGKTLIALEKRRLKKALNKSPFDKEEYQYFLGAWWSSFIDNSFLDFPKVKNFGVGLHTKDVSNLTIFIFWKDQVRLLKESLPFASGFFKTFKELKEQSKLHDSFYLNYEVANIDFEAILISSFINFTQGNFSAQDVNKMGVTISELRVFFQRFFQKTKDEYIFLPMQDQTLCKMLNDFNAKFGLDAVEGFDSYLHGVISEHLSGYELDTLDDEEFKHVGGPILLNTLVQN